MIINFLIIIQEINEDSDKLNQRNEKRRINVKVKVMKKVDSDGMYAISMNDFSNFEEEIDKVSVIIQSNEEGTDQVSVDLSPIKNDNGNIVFSADVNLKEIIDNNQSKFYIRPIVVGVSGTEYECRLKGKDIK